MLTVAELIRELQRFDPQLPVYVADRVHDDEPVSSITVEEAWKRAHQRGKPRRVVID